MALLQEVVESLLEDAHGWEKLECLQSLLPAFILSCGLQASCSCYYVFFLLSFLPAMIGSYTSGILSQNEPSLSFLGCLWPWHFITAAEYQLIQVRF